MAEINLSETKNLRKKPDPLHKMENSNLNQDLDNYLSSKGFMSMENQSKEQLKSRLKAFVKNINKSVKKAYRGHELNYKENGSTSITFIFGSQNLDNQGISTLKVRALNLFYWIVEVYRNDNLGTPEMYSVESETCAKTVNDMLNA